ncbi:MAG TPA: polysaccharide biosynthesis/export family protein [Chthoniobacterales bacterium]|nr:polysaccharide biosynthesis/export family protein [Chthoniobacterales bacterium]
MNIEVCRTLLIIVSLFGVAGAAFGQATLRVGDPVDIKIGGVPYEEQQQVNNTYTVSADGSVNLPYINKIKAAGLTPAQLARAIEESYRATKIFTNPNITIVMQPMARFVNVGGAVRQAMRVPFTEDLTLLAAINGAGGFNDFADQKHVRLLRGSEVRVYDVRQFRKDPSQDVKLQPGDRIEVPQSFF